MNNTNPEVTKYNNLLEETRTTLENLTDESKITKNNMDNIITLLGSYNGTDLNAIYNHSTSIMPHEIEYDDKILITQINGLLSDLNHQDLMLLNDMGQKYDIEPEKLLMHLMLRQTILNQNSKTERNISPIDNDPFSIKEEQCALACS